MIYSTVIRAIVNSVQATAIAIPAMGKHILPIAAPVFLILFSTAALAERDAVIAALDSVYSSGGWSTLHKGPGNRKQVRGVTLAENYRKTTLLEGSSVLTAPVMSPDGQVMYVTTGQGEGHSNLHAITLSGELIWSAPVVDEAATGVSAGVDGCAILSSPIVDSEGDVYISDCNQLWAFKPDGQIKWVVDQPLPPEDAWQPTPTMPVNAFTTAVFTKQGDILGVTNYGSVRVHDRATGAVLNEPMLVPGLQPPPSKAPLPDSMLAEGIMNEELRVWAWQLLMGGAMPSANTPAVDEATGRVFVAVSSTKPGLGALLALDVRDSGEEVQVDIAWSTDMGPGSGSSPSLSPDGSQVYVSDEEGMFYGIATSNGEILWRLQTGSAAASVAVGADGVVYSLQQNAPAIIAMSPTGERLWESDVSHLVEAKLPARFFLGQPVGVGSGNPTVTDNELLVPVSYGYSVKLGGRSLPLYVESTVVALDLSTGKGIRDVLTLPDDSSGITVVLPDGSIVSSLGAVVTSSVQPLRKFFNWMMPEGYELLDMTGGLQIARPQ